MPLQKDDIHENAEAAARQNFLNQSLAEQQALREAGDPKRLAADARLAEIRQQNAVAWGEELVKTGEADTMGRPIEDTTRYSERRLIAAE